MATTKRFVARFGIDNNGNSITNLGSSGSELSLSSGHSVAFTTTGPTSLMLPTSGTLATTDQLGSGNAELTLQTSGIGLSGSQIFSTATDATFTVTSNATDANTPGTIVARDGSGNFSAGTASLSGLNLTGDASISSTVTLSAGSVDGIVYLNGSKMLTTDSSLSFNGSNFSVNTLLTVGGTTPRISFFSSDDTYSISRSGTTMNVDSSGFTKIAAAAGTSLETRNGPITFLTGAGTGVVEQAIIDSSGNVGIGTNTPSARLHVQIGGSGQPTPAAQFFSNNDGFSPQSLIGLAIYNNRSSGFLDTSLVYGNNTNTYFTVGHHNGSTYSERLRIDALGNLGVGTAAPTSVGAGYTSLSINSSTAGVLDLMANGISQFRMFGNGTENRLQGVTDLPITFFTNSTEKMRLDSSGNLVVGASASLGEQIGSYSSGTGDVIALRLASSVTTGANGMARRIQFTLNDADGALINTNSIRSEWVDAGTGVHAAKLVFTSSAANIQTDTLTLDAAGNVGIGITPSAWATGGKAIELLNGGIYSYTPTGSLNLINNAYYGQSGAFRYKANAGASRYFQGNTGDHRWYTAPSGTAGDTITFTQAMTLADSGNLGIGTSSTYSKLTVADSSANDTNSDSISIASAYTSNSNRRGGIAWSDDLNASSVVGRIHTTYRGSTVDMIFGSLYNSGYNTTEQMCLTGGGTLGLGVTPSAWQTGFKAFETTGSAIGSNSTEAAYFIQNAYYDGSNFIYKANAPTSFYSQGSGIHAWYTAPSGTAGDAVSYTQSMTLDAAGNVLIGTSVPGASKLVIADNSIQINSSKTPASSSDAGVQGQIAWDADYVYVCVAPDTWKRSALSTW
jgi:hypothetical protein